MTVSPVVATPYSVTCTGAGGVSAFLVPKDTPGLKIGPEEHKLGIQGSSTTTVILEDAKVPVENILGEIGKLVRICLDVIQLFRRSFAEAQVVFSGELFLVLLIHHEGLCWTGIHVDGSQGSDSEVMKHGSPLSLTRPWQLR